MSYCVECGVKLEKAARKCPLCKTPVLNPNRDESYYEKQIPAYMKEKNIMDVEDRKYSVIIINLILFSLNVIMLISNIVFVPESKVWLIVFASTMVLSAVISIPIAKSLFNEYFYMTIISLTVVFLFSMISIVINDSVWMFNIAIPILISIYVLAMLWVFLKNKFNKGILFNTGTFTFFSGVLCILIQSIISNHLYNNIFGLSWSLIVFVSGISISLILLVISKNKRWREIIRKRFHF